MRRLSSLKIIVSELHELSSATKLFIIGVFWAVINFGQLIWPDLVFRNHTALAILMTVTFSTNLITEIIINYQRKNYQDFHQVLSLQIFSNTVLLMIFLVLIDHINGPLFLICTLTLMESFLNLNLTLPVIIVIIMGTSTVVEWFYLVQTGEIIPNVLNISGLIVRIVSLVFLMSYGKSLSESIIAAQEVDKMKDEFLSIASHELRTPMTSIKSYLWMTLNNQAGPLKPKQRFYLRRSYESSNRLIKLVNDMLNISRIESGRMSLELDKIRVDKLGQKIVDEFGPRAKSLKISIVLKPIKKIPEVIADEDKIKEVFYNIIGNALKNTPKNGKIQISFKVEDDYLVTSVTDTGIGMDSDTISKLFQKFGLMSGSYQTNSTGNSKGTGLGLYICKKIINLHQGEIWGESKGKDKGSMFSFSLPTYSPEKLRLFRKQFQRMSNVGIIHSKI